MRVGLFVTCLVDLMRPRIGFAALDCCEAAGCEVVVPPSQTCCGQPAYNSGDRRAARLLAEKLIAEFEGLRLCRGAFRFLRRHDSRALSRISSPTIRPGASAPPHWARAPMN